MRLRRADRRAKRVFWGYYAVRQFEGAAPQRNRDCLLKGVGMVDAREVMNIRQASQYLGVSADTLYKYVSEERIPAFKLGNR